LVYFLINIYSDSSQMALKYLKNTKVNIENILIITEDFNIRDSIWDFNLPHYSSYNNISFEVANSLNLELFRPTCYDWCLLNIVWTRTKGNEDMIGCAEVVSVSTSCSRCSILAWSSLFYYLFNSCTMDDFLMACTYI